MNFVGGEEKHLDCSFLYPTEKNAVKDFLTIWDEKKEATLNQMLQQLPFVMTDEQLILVVPEHVGGEIPAKHPILVRLESQVENLQDFIETPNLLDEKTESVKSIRNNNTERLLHFDHADRIKWPSHLSYSSLSTLVEYPLDFMMERILKIGSTGPSCIADLKTTKGNVAHAVIEHLFAPRDEKRCSKADEIAKRIEEEFDEQVRKQIEACGAILYLPENRLDAELLKESFPAFDLGLEIENNETFANLIDNGVDVRAAFLSTHVDQILDGSNAYAQKTATQNVINTIQQRASRPAEGAMHPNPAIVRKSDPSSLSNEDIDEINRRVAMGETVSF
jgi:hypothetical protein